MVLFMFFSFFVIKKLLFLESFIDDESCIIVVGFSGCHRYEAHQKLGLPTIRCKIRKGTKETLRYCVCFFKV